MFDELKEVKYFNEITGLSGFITCEWQVLSYEL